MAKVKSIIDNDQIRLYGTLDENLNGTYFNNTASQTIFSFGKFVITSNLSGRQSIDYTTQLSSFVRPVTLETIGLTDTQSEIALKYTTEAVLNLDKSDLNTYVRFGSAYEFLRICVQNIILAYPASIYASSRVVAGGNVTYFEFTYDSATNISEFKVPTAYTVNTFGIICNAGNMTAPDDNALRNLNLSYSKYIIWTSQNPTGNSHTVLGFTGFSSGHQYLTFRVSGNPFPNHVGTTGNINFHIKPNSEEFEEFRALLTNYEKYIVSERDGTKGFKFIMKDPTLLEDGSVTYVDSTIYWTTSDGYNIDISGTNYRNFLETMLNIGGKYDAVKTDLIARFLTPLSIKTYDLTEEGKMTKLLRIYGAEFDQIRQFIDSLVNINRVTYDKVNNVPDQIIKNMARTFGWDYFSLVNETELINSFLTITDEERNLHEDLLPAEIDIELWRRILINTSYFWKSKGTREAIKSMFLLIGIPEPFINITEYVYTVDGKINPNTVSLSQIDFPSNSLPYDTSGYPVAPLETNNFYFQVSGDTDSGQAYMDVFRMAGFRLTPTVDNKKSWIQTGATWRIDDTTPQYFQEDSRLVLNTKEVDVALDTSRGIEYDVYEYIKKDFAANSSGYTMPFSFVNISLPVTGTYSTPQTEFVLPYSVDEIMGKDSVGQPSLEVRYNGILLTPRTVFDGSNIITNMDTNEIDYYVTGNILTLNLGSAINSGSRRDVIQATFVYSGGTHAISGITVQYVVARIKPTLGGLGTYIPLPSYPRGDVQVTVNGIAMTKTTGQFNGDYKLDPANSTGGSNNIIIQNPDIVSYLAVHPNVTVAYVEVIGSNDINVRSEVLRVDSFSTSKLYFNLSANKYVYKLNYKVTNARDLKVLIDGIALEPNNDYSVNQTNQYEIFMPKGIKYGSVISIYYLVGGNAIYFPIVDNNFGVGDISELSFLEFIELIQRRLINARNRKTISDFKGGWYPALLRVYTEYLKRSVLDPESPLLSNGYTFSNLYSFLGKYNAFFQRFVDQLLSATIILKKSGLLVRNTVFTKQKFMYKRGVNLYLGNDDSSQFDMRGNPMIPYYGDDGATFCIAQEVPLPTVVAPTVTTTIISSITQTTANSGGNVSADGGATVLYRGIVWNTTGNPTLLDNKTTNGGGLGAFISSMSGLSPNTTYYVRAYATNVAGTGYGQEETFQTEAVPLAPPEIHTRTATNVQQTSFDTGGINIIRWADVEYYAMKFKATSSSTWVQFPVPATTGPLTVNYTPIITITGLIPATEYKYYAYMIVGGVEYKGETGTTTTAAIPASAPTVTTGEADNIETTSIAVFDNVVSNKGNPTVISEYGVLYTQSPAFGSAAQLTLTNQTANPATIFKTSHAGIGSVPFTWNEMGGMISGLQPNTMVFFRAFARNGVGESTVGYGMVENVVTSSAPAELFFASIVGGNQVVMGGNNVAGKTFSITFEYNIDAACDSIDVADPNQATTSISISIDGGSTWTEIDSVHAEIPGGIINDGDSQTKTGTYTINGITNLSLVRITGLYECSSDRLGKSGGITVTITNASANIGLVLILSSGDTFADGCSSTPYIS